MIYICKEEYVSTSGYCWFTKDKVSATVYYTFTPNEQSKWELEGASEDDSEADWEPELPL